MSNSNKKRIVIFRYFISGVALFKDRGGMTYWQTTMGLDMPINEEAINMIIGQQMADHLAQVPVDPTNIQPRHPPKVVITCITYLGKKTLGVAEMKSMAEQYEKANGEPSETASEDETEPDEDGGDDEPTH